MNPNLTMMLIESLGLDPDFIADDVLAELERRLEDGETLAFSKDKTKTRKVIVND